ncbi:flagellar hook-basal body complex protein FliE [Effusibacillus consociatus]|uniref:Flagellar hook-basal body complex protein FliE n=1 Tax=Effusibacillus consociatus TaxID=1117041 RepID=A0ABV9Q2M2_9BACL
MINRVTNPIPSSITGTGMTNQEAAGPSFSTVLGETLNKVADMEVGASKLTQQMAAGQGADLHTIMIAGEKASLALQMTIQVRNKVIDAYQEIMRMQM